MTLTEDEMYQKLEGKYEQIDNNKTHSLFLAGPNNSKRRYGEKFTLSIETIHEGDGGMQAIIRGTYELRENKLILIGKERMQESWFETGEAEGEAFVRPYKHGDITAEIDLSGTEPILHLDYSGKTITMNKKETS